MALDARQAELDHLLAQEGERDRAMREGEAALEVAKANEAAAKVNEAAANANEAAAVRRSRVMERERRHAVAAADAERAKMEEAHAIGATFATAMVGWGFLTWTKQ